MSNNRDLLKEAIADAKAVKETAIANAKAALEESFTPHLKTVLSAKLEEMEKEDMDEGYDKTDEAKDSEKMEEKKEYMTAKEKREGDDRKSDNKAETETEKMRISSDGDVLIGTTSQGNTNAYFDVASNSKNVLNLGLSHF